MFNDEDKYNAKTPIVRRSPPTLVPSPQLMLKGDVVLINPVVCV